MRAISSYFHKTTVYCFYPMVNNRITTEHIFLECPLAHRGYNNEPAESAPLSLSLHCHALGSEAQYYISRT